MNDIILVNSPLYSDGNEEVLDYLPPLGLVYIASYLKDKGKRVEVFDSLEDSGISVAKIISYINKKNPRYMGINIFSVNIELVKKICESLAKSIKIIIGGNLTKFYYKEIANWKFNNQCFIVIGDGEKITNAIIEDGIDENFVFKNNRVEVYNAECKSKYFVNNINELVINRNFCLNGYFNVYSQWEDSIITSRGCYYDCAYCGSAKSINENMVVRERTIENIDSELKLIKKNNINVKSIRVLDDLFLKSRVSIINAINLFNRFTEFSWRAMAHVLSFSNSMDLFDKMHDSGCKEIFIGIESGSKRIRKYINKIGCVDDIIKVVKGLLDAKINVKAYFIVGFPTESASDLEETFQLAKLLNDYSENVKAKFKISLFMFRPYHGTKLYKEILASGQDIEIRHKETTLGKRDFNFSAGNYSKVSDKVLNDYYEKINDL